MGTDSNKQTRGGQPRNGNARKHGLYQASAALKEFGSRAIDRRTSVGRALHQWRSEIVRDLGGEDAISAQQAAVMDVVVSLKLQLDSIDTYILSQPSLVNRRHKRLIPIVKERNALACSFVSHLTTLGLARRTPPPRDLGDYLREKTQHARMSQETGTSEEAS